MFHYTWIASACKTDRQTAGDWTDRHMGRQTELLDDVEVPEEERLTIIESHKPNSLDQELCHVLSHAARDKVESLESRAQRMAYQLQAPREQGLPRGVPVNLIPALGLATSTFRNG